LRIYQYKGRNLLKIDKELLILEHKKDISFTINNSLSEAVIESIARDTKFTKRSGKVPACCFVNAMLFSENDHAHTSLPDLTSDLNQVYGIDISKVAMHKKFTPEAVTFMAELLSKLLSDQLKPASSKDLTKHFPRIKIKDSTKFSLPDCYNEEYKGYGNFSKKNGLMSLQYEYDLVSGDWLSIKMTKGLRNDQQDSKETTGALTAGDLHIRDLGYITPIYLSAVAGSNAFFLNRLPTTAGVYNTTMEPLDWKKMDAKLTKASAGLMELDAMVYEKEKIACRLIIDRVNDQEYTRRLEKAKATAKSKGVGISELHKLKLRYNTYITNVAADILPATQIRRTYYLRWQVELVFKTWKSFFRINNVKKVKKERLECQVLAKLIWILINWGLFKISNNHVKKIDTAQSVSVLIFFKRCVKFAFTFRQVLLKRQSITIWLKHIYLPLIADCLCGTPKNKQAHHQSLKINEKPVKKV